MKRISAIIAASLIALSFAACDSDSGTGPNGGGGNAYVYMTDYQSAALGTFAVGDSAVHLLPLTSLHTDVALRPHGDRMYVVERFEKDGIIVLDVETPDVPLTNYSVRNGTNPQDIVVESASRAYVLRLAAPNVLIVNPATGDSVGTIDLSSLADADGLPEMIDGLLYNGDLYVLLQLLDENAYFAPTGPGLVAVVDPADGTIERTIALTIKNPELMIEDDGALYVVGGGWFDNPSGGVDRIDAGASTATRITEGAAMRGRPTAAAYVDDANTIWVAVIQMWPAGAVYGVDATSGAIVDSLGSVTSPASVATNGQNLLVTDTPGLYVFDAVSGDLVAGPIATPLPADKVVFADE